ncbi:hypothetical protein EJF18_10814 [Clavispora lusitaniae]|uniref:Uncharacterized protein n=1 Tax=Clavispora lusitaniae TaxID=36911 RepID=A0ACD0WDV6_CLALS|nr:hypothetical protein EJF14_10814 [Clavispora lusitaniae]QFZ30988.1 hypothetical protein EJF16_10814 [Clavispora lusitaniae]QFZ36656.1 hypothetical protein EJF15_10814 [Clavispora lusitaniae]QFZ42340.1 hypothetical protein EJF18_10814 [Clavispora lusitaniae]QFZ48016.1 hypothetical protein EJF17_10814 [Clavispora lusitaniae]
MFPIFFQAPAQARPDSHGVCLSISNRSYSALHATPSLYFIPETDKMAWFTWNKQKSPQIEQRSHTRMETAPESDIAHTLNQISSEDSLPRVQVLSAESYNETNKSVASFVSQRPENLFIIDGEKYADESIICTSDEQGNKTCLKLRYNSIELFKQMQRLEYFCSLPNNMDATYFECRKIT